MKVNDLSGNNNQGTQTGSSIPARVVGKLGQALQFDGVDDYLNVTHTASLNPSGAFSMTGWFKADKFNNDPVDGDYLFLKGDVNTTNSYSLFFYDGNLHCNIGQIWTGGPTYAVANLATGQWYHVACVADAAGHKLYINGAIVALNSATVNSVTTTDALQLGRLNTASGGYFDGTLDDDRIYNRALSPQEIKRLYKIGGTFTVNISQSPGSLMSGLSGWWTFDGGSVTGDRVLDMSGNDNYGTMNNF